MEFQIKSYVPIEQKLTLIEFTVRDSFSEGVLNPVALDMFFKLNMLLAYTDIVIEEDDIPLHLLYDKLEQQGIFERFFSLLEKEEFETMRNYLFEYKMNYIKFMNSTRGIIKETLEVASKVLESQAFDLEKFDLSKLKELLPLAESLGIDFDKLKGA